MNAEQLGKALQAVAAEWPLGAKVWHRANGVKGIIVGYNVSSGHHGPSVRLLVAFNHNSTEPAQMIELSGDPVSPDAEIDGESWKSA